MNGFVGGWLIGFACGLWFAIFLYWLWGKREVLRPAGTASAPKPKPAPPPAAAHDMAAEEPSAPAPLAGESPAPQAAESPASAPVQPDPGRSRYTRLLSIVGGDAAAAERLIDYERTRAPDAARAILIQNAIDRLLHDRR